MGQLFFGQFLLSRGVITQPQLENAVADQQDSRSRFGGIAIEKDFLTKAELKKLLALQSKGGQKIGRVAVEEKLMSNNQVVEVLAVQTGNHIHLGEVLVEQGVMQEADLNLLLDEFHEISNTKWQKINTVIAAHPHSAIMYTFLQGFRDCMYRSGYVSKIVCMHDTIVPVEDPCFFLAEFTLNKVDGAHGLMISRDKVCKFADFEEETPVNLCKEKILENNYNLNYRICKDLRKKKVKIKYGPAMPFLPKNDAKWTCIEMTTLIGNIYFLFSHFH